MSDEAPYFFDKLLEEFGDKIVELGKWMTIDDSTPLEFRKAFGSISVLKKRYVKTESKTPNPFAPICTSNLNFMLYEDTSLKLAWELNTFAPD